MYRLFSLVRFGQDRSRNIKSTSLLYSTDELPIDNFDVYFLFFFFRANSIFLLASDDVQTDFYELSFYVFCVARCTEFLSAKFKKDLTLIFHDLFIGMFTGWT